MSETSLRTGRCVRTVNLTSARRVRVNRCGSILKFECGGPLFVLIICLFCYVGVSAQNVQPFPSNGLVIEGIVNGQLQGYACVDPGRGSLFCLDVSSGGTGCNGVMVQLSNGVVSRYPSFFKPASTHTSCFLASYRSMANLLSTKLILVRSTAYAFGQNIGVFDLTLPSFIAPITWPNARQMLGVAIGNYILFSSGKLVNAGSPSASSPCAQGSGNYFFCFAELFDTTTNSFVSTTYNASSVANFAPVCNGVVYFVGTVYLNGNPVGSTVDMFDTAKLIPGAAWNTVGWTSSARADIIVSAAYCFGSTLLLIQNAPVNAAASDTSTAFLVRFVFCHKFLLGLLHSI
jgi:hypothetical protein